MRILALYLPQFHCFEENDRWWGEGYTEWTAVRRAKPLYPGHIQPRVPKDKLYYDLSDESGETFARQAKEAQKYGIYGFCFYHYYFTGKKLMQKPMEILLNHPEIPLRYCICWANESWTRAWYGLKEEILMKQEYGEEEQWEEHFQYLLPFFKDPRYILADGKPMLHIYRPFEIPCLNPMLRYFQKRAEEEGLLGIYTVGGRTAASGNMKCETDAVYYFEPGYTLKQGMSRIDTLLDQAGTACARVRNRIFSRKIPERRIPVERLYEPIMKREYAENEFPGIFARWDNTPRRSYRGLVYTGASPEKFGKALLALKKKTEGRTNDFVYVNAWNEWGEGAMLEADEAEGDAYLEAVLKVTEA